MPKYMGSELIEAVPVPKSSSSCGKLFPPGFRFHPTDEELILYYLKRKICGRSLKLDFIGEVNVYKWDPEELPGQSKWKTGDRQWFFFSPRGRKYPNGGRSSRGTRHGYWKATGKDRIIKCNSRSVGVKKTLVYHDGRAPSGQRTDWVMHEYTLDENELKRCRYIQEYYALYKLFKKSGLGPKNGEQYGAPFVEEDWLDDDNANDNYLDVDALFVQKVNPVVNEKVDFLDQVGMNQDPLGVQPGSDLAQSANEPSGLTLVEGLQPLGVNPVVNEPTSKIDFLDQLGSSHELAQSTNEPSGLTLVEGLQPLVVNEDFLEMDDLIGSQPANQNAHFDGLYEFDLYNDLELSPFESRQIQQPYYNDTDNLEYEMQNSGFDSYLNGYDLWADDQNNCDLTNAQATDGAVSNPSSSGVNQCGKNGEDDGTNSWFSSALWAFVESVPTTPASALESSAIVNKAFERFSSFSRIKNANEPGVACALMTSRLDRSSRSRRDIVYFSVVGVLFAILCVFIGTSIELLGRCIL